MIELTSGLSLGVPLMVSAFTAKLFGEFLCSGGIYDAHISNYTFNKNILLLRNLTNCLVNE
jgi:H+/Cl- antiporter ClcA